MIKASLVNSCSYSRVSTWLAITVLAKLCSYDEC